MSNDNKQQTDCITTEQPTSEKKIKTRHCKTLRTNQITKNNNKQQTTNNNRQTTINDKQEQTTINNKKTQKANHN